MIFTSNTYRLKLNFYFTFTFRCILPLTALIEDFFVPK